ncbi:MAG: DUF2007 domain-containing protein [Gammaproteobacteria bacterium]
MKRVYSSADAIHCGWLKSVLDAAGIACLLRNAYLGGAAGELPLNECWPEIWVLEDADSVRAARLIRAAETPAAPAGSWCCDGCGEALEGAFGQCWRCGRERPAPVTATAPDPVGD